MIPKYRRKRSIETLTKPGDSSTALRNEGAKKMPENLTHNPHVQLLFTGDTTVVQGFSLGDSDGLHPVIKYGIPIGAMLLLGLFIYAMFSKRWNRKAAVTTDSVETMKLNTTKTIDSIAAYVSSQISCAETSVLGHMKEKIGNASEAIIRDMSNQALTNEEKITSLQKVIAEQETNLIKNTRKKFKQTRICIIIDARDKFAMVEQALQQLLDEYQNEQEGDDSRTDTTIEVDALDHQLSEVENIISTIVRKQISNSPDALLSITEKHILHMTAVIWNNITVKNLQAGDLDWNSIRSKIKELEESLIKEVKTTIIATEENILAFLKNKINEVKQIAKTGKTTKLEKDVVNDPEVDIKQPGKSYSGTKVHSLQKIDTEKPSTSAPIQKPARKALQNPKICSKCATEKENNNFNETNGTVAIEIDNIAEIKLKIENDEIVTNSANLHDDKKKPNEDITQIESPEIPPPGIQSLNNGLEVNANKEEPKTPRKESNKNYSVIEQAENSIKLWLSWFKHAVPHLPDNLHLSDKYDESKSSVGQKTVDRSLEEKDIQREKSKDPIQQIVIDVEGTSNTIAHQGYTGRGSSRDDQLHEWKVNDSYDQEWVYMNGNTPNVYNEGKKSDEESIGPLNEEVTHVKQESNTFETTTAEIHKQPPVDMQQDQPEANTEILTKESESNDSHKPNPSGPVDMKEQDGESKDQNVKPPFTENQLSQAEKNAVNYELFKSEIELKKKELLDKKTRNETELKNGNTMNDSDKSGEAESRRKWLNIDETIEHGKEMWPSHLPKVVITPIAEKNNVEKRTQSKIDKENESVNIEHFSEDPNNEAQKIRFEERIANDQAHVKVEFPHEEILKICEGFDPKGSEGNEEGRERGLGIHETAYNSEEMCSDDLLKLINFARLPTKETNLKESLKQKILVTENQYSQNIEGQVESINDTLNENKEGIKKPKTGIENSQKEKEATLDEKVKSEVNLFDTKKWLENEQQTEKEKVLFDNNDGEKESIASASSELSSSSNETISNEKLQKEEESDTLPILKMPNLDEKLRKKRRINRRMLKSLDSGVHHYYGEYIAIEFPINDMDETTDQIENLHEMKHMQDNVQDANHEEEFKSTNKSDIGSVQQSQGESDA